MAEKQDITSLMSATVREAAMLLNRAQEDMVWLQSAMSDPHGSQAAVEGQIEDFIRKMGEASIATRKLHVFGGTEFREADLDEEVPF